MMLSVVRPTSCPFTHCRSPNALNTIRFAVSLRLNPSAKMSAETGTNQGVFTRVPPQPSSRKPGQLSEAQLKQYFDQGFLIVDKLFDTALLDEVRKDICVLVDQLAQKLYDAGKVKSLYKEEGLFVRLTKLEEDFPGANIILHKGGKLPQAFRRLWSDERLLNVAEQVLGTADIVGNPVWNLRCKTPNNEAGIVPWHQDAAYMDEESHKDLIFTAWVPLLDTDETNGGMQVIKGGHRPAKVAEHKCCYGGTWYVMLEDEEMKKSLGFDPEVDAVTCPVPYGGTLLFSNIIPHRSLPNVSQDIRWALDLRFNRATTSSGLWGLKEGVMLRSEADPDMPIDWESFEAVDRTSAQFEAVNAEEEDFDTTIHGPWMQRWDIVHMNRHTDKVNPSQQLPSIIG